ncbi:MAG: hypothetical protein B9S32_06520 [Verrucomicrobia bacterium Tous-C9LFEB]|nr:MAG: hypothetical protein B9S32_06520 [Verrucomicrobia bacterium Tous-C9LFEB]
MRNTFVYFLSLILGCYTLANFYVIWRSWVMLPGIGVWRWLIALVIIFLAMAYPLSRIAEYHRMAWFSSVSVWLGVFWIAAILYFFLIFLGLHFFDALVWIFAKDACADRWFACRPQVWTGVVVFVAGLLAYGAWNASHPRVVRMEWAFPRLPVAATSLKVVALSDLHCGVIIGRERVQKIVTMINAEKPDVILLAGDVIDGDLAPVQERKIGEVLQQLHATYGVYAVTGNHEFFGGVQPSVDYLEAHGIRVLRDEVVPVGNAFFLVGREDISVVRYKPEGRASLSNLLGRTDRSLPIFVMDHQPVALDEAEQAGADAQLSGHTHDGQFWPVNYIPKSLFKLSYGYKKFGPLNAYVSCGVGTWGPPVRIGNHPEIVVFTLKPAK